jgi:ABC-type multidrug transport system fused ATPase/permease subunit
MNKSDKEFAQKILSTFFTQSRQIENFSDYESLTLERWRTHRIINEEAFHDVTSFASKHKEFIQISLIYPFTSYGDQEIKKNWYMDFRESKVVTIIRDILTVIAFFVSLILAILKFFPK